MPISARDRRLTNHRGRILSVPHDPKRADAVLQQSVRKREVRKIGFGGEKRGAVRGSSGGAILISLPGPTYPVLTPKHTDGYLAVRNTPHRSRSLSAANNVVEVEVLSVKLSCPLSCPMHGISRLN